jgi:AsmA protein
MYTNVLKSILIAIVGLIGLLILISVALIIFVDTSDYKPRMERAASDALGMEVRVGGRLGLSFFPDLHVRLDDVHIQNRGMDIAKPCFDNRLALGAGISPKIAVVNKGERRGRSASGHSPEHLKSEDA